MDSKRKALYRELLWWAMVDMRSHSGSAVGTWRSLLSRYRRSYRRVNQFTYAMSQWLHNTALYAAMDFDGFNEKLFWRDYQQFRQSFPADRWAGLTESVIEKLRQSAAQ